MNDNELVKSVRPKSLSIVCWFLIASSSITLVTSSLGLKNPAVIQLMRQGKMPLPLQLAMLYFGLFFTIISAIAMLKGKKWGRTFYISWSALGLLIGVLTSPTPLLMIPGAILFFVFILFLTRPKVNQYFKTS